MHAGVTECTSPLDNFLCNASNLWCEETFLRVSTPTRTPRFCARQLQLVLRIFCWNIFCDGAVMMGFNLGPLGIEGNELQAQDGRVEDFVEIFNFSSVKRQNRPLAHCSSWPRKWTKKARVFLTMGCNRHDQTCKWSLAWEDFTSLPELSKIMRRSFSEIGSRASNLNRFEALNDRTSRSRSSENEDWIFFNRLISIRSDWIRAWGGTCTVTSTDLAEHRFALPWVARKGRKAYFNINDDEN